jgi:hypothetical protein
MAPAYICQASFEKYPGIFLLFTLSKWIHPMSGKYLLLSLFVLTCLLHFVVPRDLQAACSPYKGWSTINEIHYTGSSSYFVEVKILDSNITNTTYDTWSVTICSDKAGGCTSPISIVDGNDADYPWLIIDESLIGNFKYIDYKNGMDVILKDQDGNTIDYLSVTGFTIQQDAGCPPAYDWEFTGNATTASISRLPDGTGEWIQLGTGNSVPPSEGDSNEGVPNGVTPPSLAISNTTAQAGNPAEFAVTLSATTSDYDVIVTYLTLEGTAEAGTHYDAASVTPVTITIPAGSLTGSISVDTYNPAGFASAVDFYLVITQAILYDTGTSNPVVDDSGNTVYVPRTNNFALGTITVPTTGTLDHFIIDTGGGSASTCTPQTITITAIDSTDSIFTSYTGTVNITTSTSHGDWVINSANGILSNGTADDGASTYSFDASDNGSIVLDLTNTHSESATISVSDGSASVASTSAALTFSDNSFVINPTTSTDGTPNSSEIVVSRNHNFQVEMWKKDPSTGTCSIATAYNGSFNLKSWLARDGDDPAGTAPKISGSSLSDAVPVVTNLNLSFVNGVSSFTLTTSDAGKYVVNIRDDSLAFSSVEIDGSSSLLTVRPFGFGLTGIVSGATVNPGGTAHDSTIFIKAGETFQATLTAYGWQVADDSDNDGTPDTSSDLTDNAIVASFDWTTFLSANLVTPVAGVTGSLGGTTAPASGAFAAGSVTVNDLIYSEVGSMTLIALSTNYLNTAGVTIDGVSQAVGRFIPDYFEVTNNIFTPACLTGNFSYMGQNSMQVDFSIESRNKQGGKTLNYFDNFAKATVSFVAENNNDGVELSSRLAGFTAHTWAAGLYNHTITTGGFLRAATPDGSFDNLKIGFSLTDNDGALSQLTNLDMNPTTNDDCTVTTSCTAYTSGNSSIRYGRLFLANNYGSETEDLALPFIVQYYDGTDFTTNLNDDCTAVTASFVGGSYTDNLDPGETCIQDNGAPGASGEGCAAAGPAGYQFLEPPSLGDFNCYLKAPGSNNNGTVDLTATEESGGTWLQYDWDNNASTPDTDSIATATFGIYRGNDRIINWREIVR